jgi:hypothetical protein
VVIAPQIAPRSPSGDGAVIGQRFGERHANASADRGGETDYEGLPVVMGCEPGREQRRQSRYRTVHQTGETWLYVLQHERPIPHLVFGPARLRMQMLVR